jgi:VWFA-related protein
MRWLACVAITFFLCGSRGISLDDALQTNPKETPEKQEIKVKTELMEVRAVVTDKKGRIIEDLKKDDFELLENDQPQEISFFSVSKVESEPSRPGVAAPAEPRIQDKATELQPVQKRLQEAPVRTTLLFVDNLHVSFASLNRIKEAVRRFIKERLTDQDMVALVTSGQSLGIAQQFTRDRQILNYAVEQIRLGSLRHEEGLFTPELAFEVMEEHEHAQRLAADMERLQGVRNCCPDLLWAARSEALRTLGEASNSRKNSLSILKYFAEQMMGFPGKRMIVVFSDGFTMRDEFGHIDNYDVQKLIDRAVRSGLVIYSIDAKGLSAPLTVDVEKNLWGSNDPAYMWEDVDSWMQVCMPGGLPGASGSPKPGQAPSQFNSIAPGCSRCKEDIPPNPKCFLPGPGEYSSILNTSEREEQNGLNAIAVETGGKMYNDTNDLVEALGRAFDANRFYYVLSYYLSARGDEKRFRSIRVRVRNHPEYTVRATRGFLPADIREKPEDEAGKTPQQRLLKAVNASLPVTDIGISAQADFLETEADDKQVSLTVYFDGDRLKYSEQDQLHHVELEIVYVVYDSSGKQVEGTSAHVEGRLTQERLEQAKTSGFRFSRRLSFKSGAYQVRIGVREEATDRMGTASAWVEVPELAKEKLGMSSLMLRNPLDTDPAAKEGMNVSELEQIKMVQGIPLYAHDDFCDYSFRVHRTAQTSAESNLTWMNELYRNGKLVKQEQWRPVSAEEGEADSKGWFDLDGEVDLSGFDPGIYELRVSVKDAGVNKTIQRTAVFGIE